MRVDVRLDDSLAVRFGTRYVAVTQCLPSQSTVRDSASETEARRASRQEPMDEELSPDQSGKNRSDHDCATPARSAKPTR